MGKKKPDYCKYAPGAPQCSDGKGSKPDWCKYAPGAPECKKDTSKSS